jgi:thiol-disulfide isomerase/thioredoxin
MNLLMRLSVVPCLGLVLACAPVYAAGAPIKTLEIGAKAPEFRLEGVDGKWHALKDFAKAKWLVVVFTCNHCPTAQNYEERLKIMVTEYARKGVQFVAISPNAEVSVRPSEMGYTDLGDSLAEMKIRAAHRKFNFPYLYEGDKTGLSRAYGPTSTPHAFVFDAERKLRYVGRIDDSEREQYVKVRDLRNALDALLAGKPAPVEVTKAFGCSVKWSDKTEAAKEYLAKVSAEPVSVELAGAEALSALRKNDSGKLRLVNFWATWCAPCVAEFPELVAINRMYRHRAFETITVAANYPDEKKQVLDFLTKQQSSGRNLLFADTDKYKLMEAFDKNWNAALPYTVLISPKGEYLYRAEGMMDALAVKREIVKALGDQRFDKPAKSAPAGPVKAVFAKPNLAAWCIVPFDAKQRGPEDRAAMLKALGIRKLAYDWREKDIPTFDREADALQKNGIQFEAIWLTSDLKPEEDKQVRAVLDFLKRRGLKTQIWLALREPALKDLTPERKVQESARAIGYIAREAAKIGCSVGLYNHGGWFGEPENQIAIITQLKMDNIGMVYNFHHAQQQMDRFPELLPKMLPYLKAINLNGMKKDGPMIIPIGQGDRETEMIRLIRASNFQGTIGILNHRPDVDAEAGLRQNLEGLKTVLKEIGATAALKSY